MDRSCIVRRPQQRLLCCCCCCCCCLASSTSSLTVDEDSITTRHHKQSTTSKVASLLIWGQPLDETDEEQNAGLVPCCCSRCSLAVLVTLYNCWCCCWKQTWYSLQQLCCNLNRNRQKRCGQRMRCSGRVVFKGKHTQGVEEVAWYCWVHHTVHDTAAPCTTLPACLDICMRADQCVVPVISPITCIFCPVNLVAEHMCTSRGMGRPAAGVLVCFEQERRDAAASSQQNIRLIANGFKAVWAAAGTCSN